MTTRRRLVATALSTACATTALVSTTTAGAVAAPGDTISITAPDTKTARSYDRNHVYLRLGVRAVGGADGLEVRSTRPDYDSPITTTWTSGEESGTLPVGLQEDFNGLPDFLTLTFRDAEGDVVRTKSSDVCLNGGGQRVRPDAEARSPYPWGCPWNPYTLGSVQGVQAGWTSSISGYGTSLRLAPGQYTVDVDVADLYADTFGIDEASRHHEVALTVKKSRHHGEGFRPGSATAPGRQLASSQPTPAGTRPSGSSGGSAPRAAGPRPDLRSLPAFDIGLNRRGNLLRFAANVWNAGNSPLVIDGFRSADEDEMDAYQYFFNTGGQQTGYQQLDSSFHWHAANHNHWHFQDFARYRLLDAAQEPVATSGKVSFCLANTDAVDYTVPGADWQPDYTDLSTSCGSFNALSVREVLSAGSGDTYAQYRRGQALNIENLPNGTYFLSVEANPFGKLIESNTTNNDSLREITLKGAGENRRVEVSQVGVIEEYLGGGFRR